MDKIVILQPDGSLKVILTDDYILPENRLSGYVGPVGNEETILKGKEIALDMLKSQKER